MGSLETLAIGLHSERPDDIRDYAQSSRMQDRFYVGLLSCIKSWAEVYTFIDGSESEFSNVYQKLSKLGVSFPQQADYEAPPPQPSAAPYRAPGGQHKPAKHGQRQPVKEKRMVAPEVRAEEIVLSAVQMPPEMWAQDKDTAQYICQEIKSLLPLLNQAMDAKLSAGGDVGNILELNEKLVQLHPLISRAAQGDSAAAITISTFSGGNPPEGRPLGAGLPRINALKSEVEPDEMQAERAARPAEQNWGAPAVAPNVSYHFRYIIAPDAGSYSCSCPCIQRR